jgi:hypothetical protein
MEIKPENGLGTIILDIDEHFAYGFTLHNIEYVIHPRIGKLVEYGKSRFCQYFTEHVDRYVLEYYLDRGSIICPLGANFASLKVIDAEVTKWRTELI